MELKIYADRCLSCTEGERDGVIYFLAKKHGLKINIRRVYVFPELREEADSFGVPMPFVAIGDKTLDYYAIGKNMLTEVTLENFINEAKNESTNQ